MRTSCGLKLLATEITDLQQRAVKVGTEIILRSFHACAGVQRSGIADFLDRLSVELEK
eukprot:COSAG06_NODE_68329_length_231_cov_5.204545_1_plen_57_part_10